MNARRRVGASSSGGTSGSGTACSGSGRRKIYPLHPPERRWRRRGCALHVFAAAAIAGICVVRPALCLQLDVPGGERRCLGQAVHSEGAAGAAFLFRGVPKKGEAAGETTQIRVEVRDPGKRLIHPSEPIRFETEKSAMKAIPLPPESSGLYEICFVSMTGRFGPRRVELLERMAKPIAMGAFGRPLGDADNGNAGAADAAAPGKDSAAADAAGEAESFGGPSGAMMDDDSMEGMPLEWLMRQAENTALTLSVGMDYELEREATLSLAADRTRSRISVFSWLSVAVLLVSSVWQLLYLKRFFKSKKLL